MRLAVIYRPPYSSIHPVTPATFFTEFADYLESFVMCTEPIIICGDFNFHVDDPEDTNASTLMDLLNSMDLVQHVGSSTQVSGHTLDLVITRKMDTIIRSQPVADCFLSDHATVICDLNLSKAPITSKRLSYRKLRAIALDSLKEDLRSSRLCESPLSILKI